MDTTVTLGAEPRRPVNGIAPNGADPAPNGADPAPNRAEPFTLASAAELLGLSVDALRRRMNASGIRGRLDVAPHGGRRRLLTPAEVDTLRGTAPTGADPIDDSAPNRAEARATAPTGADPDAGWRAALAAVEAERDRLRSELASERVTRQEAARRVEEAERGRASAEQRVEALRAAWWQWYALATGWPWWRRARRLPEPPGELTAGKLLAGPTG